MLRKVILAAMAAGLIGLAATPADAQRFGHRGWGGAHFGGGWGGHRWGGGWRGPGWGGVGLGLGLGLATAPLWASPYPYGYYGYGYPAYAYDPCWRRVWWHGAWRLRRVCW
jgi:hypothetical protein